MMLQKDSYRDIVALLDDCRDSCEAAYLYQHGLLTAYGEKWSHERFMAFDKLGKKKIQELRKKKES